MSHGAGGRCTDRLVRQIFAPAFGMEASLLNDGAEPGDLGWVVSTDAHVVHPLFFPGGDIGALAAHGTCNDLAMAGAKPEWLAVSWIIEEGTPFGTLDRIAHSLAAAARCSGAKVVAGDTKVVERGQADGVFLQSAGFGRRVTKNAPSPRRLEPGFALVLSGDIARHGMAVQSVREGGLGFDCEISSDCGGLWPMVHALLEAGLEPVAMRDCTRGGLATVLAEWAEESALGLRIEEEAVPVLPEVRAACELLGFDPLYIANEGRFLAAVPAHEAKKAVEILRSFSDASMAATIGEVTSANAGRAVARQPFGSERVLDRLSGEILPRIC